MASDCEQFSLGAPFPEVLQCLVDPGFENIVKCSNVCLIQWIKVIVILEMIKEFVKQLSHAPMHVPPQSLDALVVHRAADNDTPPITSAAFEHAGSHECIFFSLARDGRE